jgi:hypothetical protein
MLNTYIKNRGITKTIMHNNNDNQVNQINWDADYDGNIANISVNTNTNGKHNHYNITLDNEDLANILNVDSVNMPLHRRLKNDFKDRQYLPEDQYIELPTPKFEPRQPINDDELLSKYISSPLPNEELIVPLTINKKTSDNYTFTPKKIHKKLKSHITHRVYKKHKTLNRPKSKSGRSKSSKRKSSSIVNFF